MTTLLTADEAARLVPGERLVIVRTGDWQEAMFEDTVYFAPQDWVALTGACPQPSAAYAMTICSRCGHMRLSWDSPCHCPVTVPMVSWLGFCDWGGCNQPTARWRFDDDAGWLPVCAEHGRRIVPLYQEWDCREDGHPDGYECPPECDQAPRVLVGRGSIEVVPVVDGDNDVEYERGWITVYDDDEVELWIPQDIPEARFRTVELALDPLPVPARDFGIVINCVELT